jgi:uncharacterized membrane protein YGL010W
MATDSTHMTNPETWLRAYGRLRVPGPGHPSEWLGTPLAIAGLVGWLWSLPTPAAFSQAGPALNWGTVFLMATTVYYFILSISLAFGALPMIAGFAVLSAWVARSGLPLGQTGCAAFLVALSWQLVVSRHDEASLAIIPRLQHLMIGPLWLLAAVYRRLGIPY